MTRLALLVFMEAFKRPRLVWREGRIKEGWREGRLRGEARNSREGQNTQT